MKIKNIIFDLGGVIIDHSLDRTLDKMSLSKEERERLKTLIKTDKMWDDLDSYKFVHFEDALNDLLARHPKEKEEILEFFSKGFLDDYRTFEKGLSLFYRFKKEGYPVYILTNFSLDGYKKITDKFDFFSDADGILVSYKVKLIKPDRRIYRLLLEKFDLMAEQCLFLDDRPQNVEAAKKEGIHAIVYDEKTIDEELKAYFC